MKGPLPAWLEGKTAEQKENKRADYQLSSHATCPRHWQQAILQSMSSYQQALYCTCSTLSLRRGLFWVLISSEMHPPMRHYRSTFLPFLSAPRFAQVPFFFVCGKKYRWSFHHQVVIPLVRAFPPPHAATADSSRGGAKGFKLRRFPDAVNTHVSLARMGALGCAAARSVRQVPVQKVLLRRGVHVADVDGRDDDRSLESAVRVCTIDCRDRIDRRSFLQRHVLQVQPKQ